MTKWEKNTNMRTILHIILQNSKTLPTVIEQCTTKDNTSRLQCPCHIYKNVKWLFPRLVYLQTQNLLSHYIRLLERDWNITINNIVNSYFFLFCFCFLFEFFAKKKNLFSMLNHAADCAATLLSSQNRKLIENVWHLSPPLRLCTLKHVSHHDIKSLKQILPHGTMQTAIIKHL